MDEEPILVIIKDSEDLQNLLVQINVKNGLTAIISNNSAWE